MAGRLVKWIWERILTLRCRRLNRQLILMRCDGRIRLLEMAKEN